MSRTTRKTKTAQELAIAAADRYFAALASDLPFDSAAGKVNLNELAVAIQTALDREYVRSGRQGNFEAEDCALRAGYLIGVQMGLRMKDGAR